MFYRILILVFIFNFSNLSAEELAKNSTILEQKIQLTLGKNFDLQLKFNANEIIKNTDESTVKATLAPSKKEILLTGLKPGESTLTLRDVEGNVKARLFIQVKNSDK